ncbi:hypothetical protein BCR42DRAFT_490694 [Absidia repens]|uniref:Protein JTB n=1 Tax=Absidia repens TaxID=90262 RepID=A0A1X2IKH4_9FUNG|nr:hypothetical protein BCR42DRAFT_490694 [Absidia repens]
MKGSRILPLLLLLSCFRISITLATVWYDKRALPSGLGRYTYSHENVEKPTYTCVPIGECDVCTALEKKTADYCLEYGNKEQVNCQWDDPSWVDTINKNDTDDDVISLPTHRACPWVEHIEKWRLIKFEMINFVIVVFSVLVYIWRQRKLAREKYQQMVQRIGVPA